MNPQMSEKENLLYRTLLALAIIALAAALRIAPHPCASLRIPGTSRQSAQWPCFPARYFVTAALRFSSRSWLS
jgi:hypothetical protein